MISDFIWPPPYQLRASTRVRSARLRVCPYRGLQVIIPPHFSPSKVPGFIEKHRTWVEQAWCTLQPLSHAVSHELPTKWSFNAVSKAGAIKYEFSDVASFSLNETSFGDVVISGAAPEVNAVNPLLRTWLRKQAKQHLVQWIEERSKETGLHYARVTIRSSHTRWGSCSAKNVISLNERLLFLPAALVRYVITHELAHTVHLNHSSRFWRFLEQLEPEMEEHIEKLRVGHQYVPTWAFELPALCSNPLNLTILSRSP